MGFRWALLKLFLQVLHNILQLYLTLASQLKEIIDVRSYCAKYYFLFWNNVGILHKCVLIDLHAHNSVHVKTSLYVCFEHALRNAWNLSRLEKRLLILSKFLSNLFFSYSNLKLWITSIIWIALFSWPRNLKINVPWS